MQCHHVVRFDESLFVNRERARQEFVSAVFSAGLPVYLEFHGVSGMGKTEWLKWIAANPGREPGIEDFQIGNQSPAAVEHSIQKIDQHLAALFRAEVALEGKVGFRVDEAHG